MKKLILPLLILLISVPASAQECDLGEGNPTINPDIRSGLVERAPVSPGDLVVSRSKSQDVSCSVAAVIESLRSAQEDDKRLIGQLEQAWDGSDWQDVSRASAEYDENGFLSELFFERWISNEWTAEEKDTFENDANGNTLVTTIEFNFGSGLEPYERQTATYDENGNQETSFAAMWDGSDWVDWFRAYLTHNENNQQTGFMNEVFDTNLDDWVYSFAGIFTYDGQDRLEQLLNQFWNADDEVWEDALRTTYTYDGSTEISVQEFYDAVASEWNPNLRETITVDGEGREIEFTIEFWSGTEFVNSFRSMKTYGPNGIETDTGEDWNGTAFVPSFRVVFLYDSEGCLVEELEQLWDGSDWVDSHRYVYTYEATATSVEDPFALESLSIDVYPNPTVDVVTFELANEGAGDVSIAVYDVLGRQVETIFDGTLPVGKATFRWNASSTASGTYFVKVDINSRVTTRSVIVH